MFVQLLFSLVYVLFGWFTSVDIVLQVNEDNTPVLVSLLAFTLADLAVNLNTMQVGTGWTAKTRAKIFMRYLRTECCFDLYILIFAAAMMAKPQLELEIVLEVVAIGVMGCKFNLKTNRVRT